MRCGVLAIATLVCACEAQVQQQVPLEDSKPLEIHAVNYPLLYFAERTGGDAVRVTLPAPADVDPAHWSPDPETVAAFQGADLILLNGAGYAKWVGRASLPRARLVDTSAAFRDRLIPRVGGMRHVHGPRGQHAHGDVAFTTWLDPELAALQARAVVDALARERLESADDFRSRFQPLEDDLKALDDRLAEASERLGDAPLLFSHPVYEYLARRYDLNARSLDWEPDASPDAAAWRELDAILEEHAAGWMLWEAEPLEETRRRLESLGVRSAVFDPCANVPSDGDWLSVMGGNAAALEGVAG